MVIDAGGGTIDISSYTVKSMSPLEVEEFHESTCNVLHLFIEPVGLIGQSGFYQGAEVVTARARAYAEGKLEIVSCAYCLVSSLHSSEIQELQV